MQASVTEIQIYMVFPRQELNMLVHTTHVLWFGAKMTPKALMAFRTEVFGR